MTEFERGDGTPLHLHPYPELFLVARNTALFTAGEEELSITAGHFVLVPANTPHRYVGASDEAVRVVSVHASGSAGSPLAMRDEAGRVWPLREHAIWFSRSCPLARV